MVNKNNLIAKVVLPPKQDWYEIVAKVNIKAKVCIRLIYIYAWFKLSFKNILIITNAGTCSWIEILWVNAYKWLITLISYMLRWGKLSVTVLCSILAISTRLYGIAFKYSYSIHTMILLIKSSVLVLGKARNATYNWLSFYFGDR